MKHVRHEYCQLNHAPPHEVFPLLCPVREREWAVGWQCEMVHSFSGVAELGAVFTTPRAGEPDTTWIITRYEAEIGCVEFATFTPGLRIGRIEIQISAAKAGSSFVDVAYSYVALSAAGEEFLEKFTETYFAGMMRDWEEEINHYLSKGNILQRG